MSAGSEGSPTGNPPCFAQGCCKEGKFVCKRCKNARYCSTHCQQLSWSDHKKECSGKIERPYMFDYSYDRTVPEKRWLVSDMKKGPVQPMDPPEEFDYFSTYWYDRTVEISGKVVVKSSFFPPKMKELIRKGLRDRDLTWEYLFSDNFMSMMVYAWVPLQHMLEQMLWVVIPAAEKPSLQGIVELVVEHFWRVIGMPGQLDYDPAVGALLQKLNVTLPFTDSHCYEDELRQYTHDLSQYDKEGRRFFGDPHCDCFTCQARPYKEARAREAWEVLRRRVAKKGMYMMSWSAKQEFEQQVNAESVAGIDSSSKVTVLQWTHGPDEQKTVKSSFTKAELTELGRYIDIIHKQQRLPLDEEMDWIMRKVSVSQERYQQETRREAQLAVARAQQAQQQAKQTPQAQTQTQTSGSGGGKKGVSAVPGSGTKSGAKSVGMSAAAPVCPSAGAPRASSTTMTTTSNTTTTTTSAVTDPHAPRPSLDPAPTVSGVKAGAMTSTTDTSISNSGVTDGLEQCAAQLSSVHLTTSTSSTTPSRGSGDSGVAVTAGAPEYTATGRPQRRAAAKVVSYVTAGVSSSDSDNDDDDEHAEKSGGRGSGGVSGGESSEGWSDDTSEAESSSSEGSADEEDEEGGECESGLSEEEGSVCGEREEMKKGAKRRAAPANKRNDAGGSKKKTGVRVKIEKSGGANDSRAVWNEETDARLTEAVRLFKEKDGWARVAEHMGGQLTGKQCEVRWSKHLAPLQQGLRKRAEWTETELASLSELVQRHTIAPYWSEKYKVMTQERVDWKAIGKELGRVPKDCQRKRTLSLESKMKKGPFTTEEDALIRQRVVEWSEQGKGKGLWVSLEKEMGRAGDNIRSRWNKSLKKKN